jgi:hypothetical protein
MSWIRRITIIKMSMILKVIYTFNTIVIKISMAFFREIEKNSVIQIESQKSLISKSNCKKKLVASHFLILNYIRKL